MKDRVYVDSLFHSAKGTTWKKHKYVRKEGDRYIYPEDLKTLSLTTEKKQDTAAELVFKGGESAYSFIRKRYEHANELWKFDQAWENYCAEHDPNDSIDDATWNKYFGDIDYDKLEHYGIKDQKWYQRRFQNPDGSLTAAGKERYGEWKPAERKKVTLKQTKDKDGSSRYNIETETGEKVGNISTYHQSDDSLRVSWIGVDKKHKNSGYASSAMNNLIEDAKSKGYKKVTVVIPKDKADIQHIYGRLGFKPSDENLTKDEIADSIMTLGDVVKMEYSLSHADELMHYGVSKENGAPGPGSGRYPKGSGKRPFQHEKLSEESVEAIRKYTESGQIVKGYDEMLQTLQKDPAISNQVKKLEKLYRKANHLYRTSDQTEIEDVDAERASKKYGDVQYTIAKNLTKDIDNGWAKFYVRSALAQLVEKTYPYKGVFISGSSKTQFEDNPYYRKELPKEVSKYIDELTKENASIIVGDAPGIDRQVQDYLKSLNYQYVSVYGPGMIRYNADKKWKTNPVDYTNYKKDSEELRRLKDKLMTKASTESLAVVLDEGSNATRRNIERSKEQGKEVKVYELNKAGSELDRWVDDLLDDLKHSDDELMHYGVSIDDGAPGPGSGRYPKGSGKRPNQHDQNHDAGKKRLNVKALTSRLFRPDMDSPEYSAFQKEIEKRCETIEKEWIKTDVEFKKYREDKAYRNKINESVDLGLKAIDRLRGPGYVDWEEYNRDPKGDREWFLFEDQTIGLPAIARLINEGYTAKECSDLVSFLDDYASDLPDDNDGYRCTFDVWYGNWNGEMFNFAKYCEEAKKERMKHSDLDSDYLAHYGRSKLDGAPIGSGRFRLGSGERPYQHDQNRDIAKRKITGAKGGLFNAIGKRIQKFKDDRAETKRIKKEWEEAQFKLAEEAHKKEKKLKALEKARAAKAANKAKAAADKEAADKHEAEKKAAIASGDPERIAKYISELSNDEQQSAIDRMKLVKDIQDRAKTQANERAEAAAAEEAKRKAFEEANRPKTKEELRKEKFDKTMEKLQQVLDKGTKVRDLAEKGIDIWNTVASINNAFNDKKAPIIKRPEQFFKEAKDEKDAIRKREQELEDRAHKEQREDEKAAREKAEKEEKEAKEKAEKEAKEAKEKGEKEEKETKETSSKQNTETSESKNQNEPNKTTVEGTPKPSNEPKQERQTEDWYAPETSRYPALPDKSKKKKRGLFGR